MGPIVLLGGIGIYILAQLGKDDSILTYFTTVSHTLTFATLWILAKITTARDS